MPEVNFAFRQSALTHIQKRKGHERLVRFVTTYHPAVKKFKINTDEAVESDTRSAVAEKNFYETSDHLLQKRKIP